MSILKFNKIKIFITLNIINCSQTLSNNDNTIHFTQLNF